MSDEPFGRQPMPVTVIMTGNPIDVEYYRNQIISRIEGGSYDVCTVADHNTFTIHPRAVND